MISGIPKESKSINNRKIINILCKIHYAERKNSEYNILGMSGK